MSGATIFIKLSNMWILDYDAGPTFKQHWVHVLCLMELQLLFYLSKLALKWLQLSIVNTQGWLNGGHPLARLALH